MSRRPARPGLVKKSRSATWHLVLSAVVLVAAVATALYIEWRDRPEPVAELAPPEAAQTLALATGARQFADAFYSDIDRALEERGLWPELVRKERGTIDQIRVRVPADLPLAEINLSLTLAAQERGGRILQAIETRANKRIEMKYGFDSLHTTSIVLTRSKERRRTGRIAIVLDDFGSDSRLVERFCALTQPLTLAILPNTGPVDALVERARQSGHQIILHLPMEPTDYPTQDPGLNAVMLHQSDEEVRQTLRHALEQVPGAIGFNNHMGSKATADERVMRLLLEEAKARELLFLDSRTTNASIAYDLAQKMGVASLRRDSFIDEIDERQAIEAKLWDLAEMAGRTSSAIAIGHDRENTLLALESILPRLEMRGFRFETLDKF
ncbi:MAG: divergent polysaccharide deacetylase family protein [Candidatus Latescibacterota bacterium]|jgi:polysaccharide deacetylase 2 family uncharacterized protein YibQ